MGIKNILRWLIGFTLLFLPAVGAVASEQEPPQARQGALNLEHWNFLRDGLVKLEGEYTFVWDRLIPPNEATQETTFLKVPGPWTSQPYPIEGQASYQLRLKVPIETNLHLMTLMIAPNARIFINGREQANFGPVDATGRPSGVETYPQRYRVFPLPEGRELLITIHILNRLQRPPGILQSLVVGTSDQLVAFERGTKILDGMILGSLFALTLYHIFLYLLRPKDRTPLYFGICLVACFFYWLVAGYTSPINAFWDIHDADRLTVFFLIYFVVPAFSEYVSLAYPGLFPTRFLRPLWLGTLASFVIVAVVPIQLKFVVMSIYFVTFFPTAAWLCGRAVWKAHQRGDHGSMLFLAGILVLVASTIHDDMMYRMAFSNFPLIGWGVVAFSLIQSYFISARFSQAFTRAETSEAEIRLMNRDLEKIIEEKTRDIRSIMEHIPLGVFMFDANNYGIHKDYSVQSHRIFNRSKLQGLNALQLLFDRSQLTLDEKNQASCAVDSALDQELFNFEANAHCLPLEIIRQDQGREAFFELSWSPIEDAENKIQRLLVTMRDVTEFRSLQRKAQEQNDTLEILAEILKVPPKRFTEFMRDGLQTLSSCEALLQNASPEGSERLVQDLFVPIHTLKGTGRSLHLRKITDTLHQVEQRLATQRGHILTAADGEKLQADLQRLSEHLAFYARVAQDILSHASAPASHVEWSTDELEALIQRLQNMVAKVPDSGLEVVIRRLQYKCSQPIRQVLERIVQCVPDLARDLEKPEPKLLIHAHEIRVYEAGERLLQHIFIHILRNALDHGLESAEERRQKGKATQGSLDIEVVHVGDAMHIQVRDDGRGLALQRLRQLGRDRGYSPEELKNDDRVAALIFENGLTTAPMLSDISGRGVGMSAIRQFVEANGGTVRLVLDPGPAAQAFRAFSLSLQLPMVFFLHEPVEASAGVA